MATITGTPTGDLLTGTDGEDVIYGLDGGDLINGLLGADLIYAGAGSDVISFTSVAIQSPAPPAQGMLDGGEGYDVIDASQIDPVTFGTIKNSSGQFVSGVYIGSQVFEIRDVEEIRLGRGNNFFSLNDTGPSVVRTGGGNDNGNMNTTGNLFLDDGDDTVFLSAYSTDQGKLGFLSGGSGKDTLKFNNGFLVDLALGTADSAGVRYAVFGFERFEGMAQSGSSTFISGSDAAEEIAVNSLFNDGSVGVTYDGRGGDDVLSGSLGNDYLVGGSGNDVVSGSAGNDLIFGGSGRNTLDGGDGFDIAVLSASRASVSLYKADGKTYVLMNGEVDEIAGIERLRFSDGATLDSSQFDLGLRAFNPLEYIAANPDLLKWLGVDKAAGANHYLNHGFLEARSTTFDALSYIASNPDLLKWLGSNAEGGLQHYIQHGFSEGRTIAFDPQQYLAANTDLLQRYGNDSQAAAKDYIDQGFANGRPTSFDSLSYIASNPDLLQWLGADAKGGTKHFVEHGLAEGRAISFDGLQYIATNADLLQWLGNNPEAGTRHYIEHGYGEARSANFDPVAYLLSNPDLGGGSIGSRAAMQHWVEHGFQERRSGDSVFAREQSNHELLVNAVTTAAFETPGDHDWFSFSATAGQTVKIDFESAFAGAQMSIYDEGGKWLGAWNDATSPSSGMTYSATHTGDYYLAVEDIRTVNEPQSSSYSLDLVIL